LSGCAVPLLEAPAGLGRAASGSRHQAARLRGCRSHGTAGRSRGAGARRSGPSAFLEDAPRGRARGPDDHDGPPVRGRSDGAPDPRDRGTQPRLLLQARLLPLCVRGRAQGAGERRRRAEGPGRAERPLRRPARIPQPRGLSRRPGLGHRARHRRVRSALGRLLLRRATRGRGGWGRRLAGRAQPRGSAPEDGRDQGFLLGEDTQGLAAAQLPARRGHGGLEGVLHGAGEGRLRRPRLAPPRVRDSRRDRGGETGEHARRRHARPGFLEGAPGEGLRRIWCGRMRLSRRDFAKSLAMAPFALPPRAAATVAPPPTDVRIAEVRHGYEDWVYRAPYKFGGRVVDRVTILNVRCRVETRNGATAGGFGSMTLGNMWAFPSPTVSYDVTLEAMKSLAERIDRIAGGCREFGHPLDL